MTDTIMDNDDIPEAQNDDCTEETHTELETVGDSERVPELKQQIELWHKNANLLEQKYNKCAKEIVQLHIFLQETYPSLQAKLHHCNEKIAELIEHLSLKEILKHEKDIELSKEMELQKHLMDHLTSRRDSHSKIKELQGTVDSLKIEKNKLQEELEGLKTNLQIVHSKTTSEHALRTKMADIKLTNAKLNEHNKKLNLEVQKTTEKMIKQNKENESLKLEMKVMTEKRAEHKYEAEVTKFEKLYMSKTQSSELIFSAGVNTSDGCTTCLKNVEEVNALKSQLSESEKEVDLLKTQLSESEKHCEQIKQESMQKTELIGDLNNELLIMNRKLNPEKPKMKKCYLNKYRMQLPPPRYHYRLRAYQMWMTSRVPCKKPLVSS